MLYGCPFFILSYKCHAFWFSVIILVQEAMRLINEFISLQESIFTLELSCCSSEFIVYYSVKKQSRLLSFLPGLFFWLFFNLPYFIVGWGFGVGVSDWVFRVTVFSWWGFWPVVSGFLGFLWVGALNINIEE